MLKRWFHRLVLRRWWLTFLVMAVSFCSFGMVSLNLFFVMKANFNLIAEHGWQALADGGLEQAIELVISSLFAMAAYVIFKTCEHSLVHGLSTPPSKDIYP